MSWEAKSVLDQRRLFVIRVELGEENITELCEEFSISRKTGYKWISRYKERGIEGLVDLDRRPKSFREEIPNEVVCEIIRIRKWKPLWGGRKIRRYLLKKKTFKKVPAARTIDRYLKRCGYVTSRSMKQVGKIIPEEIVEPKAGNDVWSIDFKGWWRLRDNKRCEPLTIMDLYCKYVIVAEALDSTSFEAIKPVFIGVFKRYGMPLVIRSDNGSPFASTRSLFRLTRFGIWLMKLGIIPNHILPASPYMNGSLERMHLEIANEIEAKPGKNIDEEKERLSLWKYDYNHERPHDALNGDCPIMHYKKSPRKFSGDNFSFEYPHNFDMRRVSKDGYLAWKNKNIRFAKVFRGEYIGLEPLDDISSRVWFFDFCLGIINSKSNNFIAYEALKKHNIGKRIKI